MDTYHYVGVTILILLYCIMLWAKKLPNMESVQKFVTMLDTKGGNIMVLVLLALYFFHDAQVMYYIVIDKIKDGTITADNGIALNGLMFATGAFSGVSGALLKVMSGQDVVPAPGTTVVSTTKTEATTSGPPVPPVVLEDPKK